MKRYRYEALTADGGTTSGEIQAAGELDALEKLSARGLEPFEIRPIANSLFEGIKRRSGPLRLVDYVELYRGLAQMVSAGAPLLEALETIEESTERPQLAAVVRELHDLVRGGTKLAEAMRMTGKFPEAHIATVTAAEESGKLDKALYSMATAVDQLKDLYAKVKEAMTYPLLILALTVGISYYLLTRLVPKILGQFMEIGLQQVPGPTKVTMAVADFLNRYGLILVVLIVGLIYLFGVWARTPQGRRTLDAFKLKAKLIGPITKKIALVQFGQTLGFLYEHGVSLNEALSIAGKASGNVLVEEAAERVRARLEAGMTLSEALADDKEIFTPKFVAAARIGERSANLADPFYAAARNYNQDAMLQAGGLSKVLEPILLVFLAVIVGAIMLSIFLPMYDLMDQLRQTR
ncbi:Type II secretion system F domain (plasmid) [Oceanithermus profundus DSM 14977]|uniref:Type II secretion system F domain n=1 Tax=Oceanithermus profundus (strain DSM 14977 / NBRC 100410 / VKM B-2274 / 506) TaxID=670487 RepID=E4UAN2_OCEP5|nr:type II secretion system F family protein [Oceanithermus profundus]ADR37811.1 Type II secretion system F domain [Oceanithermus profundus DSM 14977]